MRDVVDCLKVCRMGELFLLLLIERERRFGEDDFEDDGRWVRIGGGGGDLVFFL